MDDEVSREGNAVLADPTGEFGFVRMRSRTRDPIGAFWLRVLKTELDMIEAALNEARQTLARQPDPRCNQIRIKPGFMRGVDQFFEIGARQRLPARQMNVKNTHPRSFSKDSPPVGSLQLRTCGG